MFSKQNKMILNICLCLFLSSSIFVTAQKAQRIAYIDMEYILDNVPIKDLNETKAAKYRNKFLGFVFQSFNLINRLSLLKESQKVEQHNVPRIQPDDKDFGIGAQILHDLNISKLRLITNTEQAKRVGMIGYGLEIVDYVSY